MSDTEVTPIKWPNVRARYSPIAPLPLLNALHKKGVLGGYLLLLAHDVLENPDGYRSLIGEVRQCHEDAFIIMDNSLIELGSALGAAKVIEAAHVVAANAIMTPDALGGFHATQELILEQADVLLDSGYHLMKVPQGKTPQELVHCVNWLRSIFPAGEEPDYWGIPRWIANKMKSRASITQYVCTTSATPRVHLLGMSQHLSDDLRCASFPDVMGIDSANPLTLGFQRHSIADIRWAHVPRGKLWDRKRLNQTVVNNIKWIRDGL